MAKERTEAEQAERAEIRRKAKEAAQAAGRDWRALSKEERRTFVRGARKASRKSASAPDQ